MNYYVECKTKEEAKRLQEYLEKTRPTINYTDMLECWDDYWNTYEEDTCYQVLDYGYSYASKKYFEEKRGITDFISVDDYINRERPAFHVDDKLKKAAKDAARVFKEEKVWYLDKDGQLEVKYEAKEKEEQPKKYLMSWNSEIVKGLAEEVFDNIEDADEAIKELDKQTINDYGVKLYEISKEYDIKVDTKIIKKEVK